MVAKVDFAGIRIDRQALAAELRGPNGSVARYAIKRAEDVRQKAKQLVGVDTGKLKASIVKRFMPSGSDGFVVMVGVETSGGVDYALYHHEGTRPHVILPRKGRYLVFTSRSGALVFARKVNHPGTKANPFLENAARQEGLKVRTFIGR